MRLSFIPKNADPGEVLAFLQSEDEDGDRAASYGRGLEWLARADGESKDGRSHFVASEGRIDRHGDIVEQNWRLGPYRANPVILWEHQSQHVVGRGSVKIERGTDVGDRLLLAVEWHASELNPLGMLAAEQHRLGFRSAVSVGFIPGQTISRTKLPADDAAYVDGTKVPEWRAGYKYRFPELLEVSTVSVPALASALQVREWAVEAEAPEEQVRRLLLEMTGPAVRQVLRDVASQSEDFRRAVRSYVLGSKVEPSTKHNDLHWLK